MPPASGRPAATIDVDIVAMDMGEKQPRILASELDTAGLNFPTGYSDDGGNLKYYLRQDGAPLVAEKISQMKAFTAVAMEKSTAEVGEISKAETPGIELVPNLIKFGGGIPIKNSKGQILGGIGVSGASKEDDAACAQAGLDAVKALLK